MRLNPVIAAACARRAVHPLLLVLVGISACAALGIAQAQSQPADSSGAAGSGVGASGEGGPIAVVETPPASTEAAPKPAVATQLEEVVVTATKRAQSVRNVPATIDVLTGARLEAKGARELKDFIDLVPGIKMADQTGDTPRKIAIRGVGPDDTTNQTVGTVLGDVPLSDPYGSYTVVDPDPWDLKTVEVLKGPQGTLFGASSLAGMIRYVPNGPELGRWEARGFADWVSVKDGGSAPTYGAALNIPVGSTLAFRAAGVAEHDPGVIDIDTVGRHVPNADSTHKWFGRAMALWQPFDRLTINAWYMDQQAHSDEQNFVTNSNGQLQRNDAPDPSPTHRAFSLGALDMRYAFDWATLVSLSAHQHKVNHFDLDSTYTLPGEAVAQSGLSVTHGLRDVEANGFVQELRLVSPDGGPWTWLAGSYYSTYNAYLLSDIYVPNTGNLGALLSTLPFNLGAVVASPEGISLENEVGNPLKAGERALFGEVTRKLWSNLDLTLGARLYRTTVDGTVTTGGVLATAIGFKSSTLWNYEIGTRTDWFHKTLRFDLTAFYIDWKNAQVTEEDAADINTYVDNVGAVRSRGLENSIRYLFPLKGLSIEINTAYVDAKTTVPFTNTAGTTVPIGSDMPNSSRLQTASTLGYSHPFGPWKTLSSLEYLHANTSWNDIGHDHLLDARNTFNLNFSLSRRDLSFLPTFSVVVDNLTDERKIVAYRHGESTLSSLAGTPVVYTRPRTLELRMSADF